MKGSSRLILPEVMGYSMPGYRFISEFRRVPGDNTARPHHDSWCSLISYSNIQNFPIFRAPSTTELPPFGCGSEPQKSLTPKSCGVTNGAGDNTGAPNHQPKELTSVWTLVWIFSDLLNHFLPCSRSVRGTEQVNAALLRVSPTSSKSKWIRASC